MFSYSRMNPRRVAAAITAMSLTLVAVGCSSTSTESAQRDAVTANVGKYDPAPAGISKPRVGVPPFNVKTGAGFSGGGDLNDLAADQMSTLLYKTDRFQVIERAQLSKLLDEQDMEGIVKPGELAGRGKVRGVDYLLIGKVTDLSVKKENKTTGFGIAKVTGFFNAGGGDYKKTEIVITTEAGVDLRLVDPTTGDLMWSNLSQYKKTDAASAMGIDILGASAQADADIKIDENNKGKILRLALDDCIKDGLADMDKFLKNRKAPADAAAPTASHGASPAQTAAPVNSAVPAAGKKFCPQCGTAVAPDAKFCPKDGAAL